jgi:hypothetical protein
MNSLSDYIQGFSADAREKGSDPGIETVFLESLLEKPLHRGDLWGDRFSLGGIKGESRSGKMANTAPGTQKRKKPVGRAHPDNPLLLSCHRVLHFSGKSRTGRKRLLPGRESLRQCF